MNETKEQEKIKKIHEYVLKSGFPSEIEIGNILRKNGWIVVNQSPYVDKVTKKIRAIDVLAMKIGLPPPVIGFQLLIECKKSTEHEWVFHTQQKEGEFLPALVTVVELVKRLAESPLREKFKELVNRYALGNLFGLPSGLDGFRKLSGLHVLNNNIKIGVFQVIPSAKDDFFEAIQQVASALKSSNGTKSFIVFPVVVFDGEIYEFYQENNEMKVLPTNHIQFVSFQEDMAPCMIDVVRKTYFSDFLKLIEQDFSVYNELLRGS